MPNDQNGMDLAPLRSFTYTAMFPFAHHLDFRGLLPYIDELDIKLAPDPDSGTFQYFPKCLSRLPDSDGS